MEILHFVLNVPHSLPVSFSNMHTVCSTFLFCVYVLWVYSIF